MHYFQDGIFSGKGFFVCSKLNQKTTSPSLYSKRNPKPQMYYFKEGKPWCLTHSKHIRSSYDFLEHKLFSNLAQRKRNARNWTICIYMKPRSIATRGRHMIYVSIIAWRLLPDIWFEEELIWFKWLRNISWHSKGLQLEINFMFIVLWQWSATLCPGTLVYHETILVCRDLFPPQNKKKSI